MLFESKIRFLWIFTEKMTGIFGLSEIIFIIFDSILFLPRKKRFIYKSVFSLLFFIESENEWENEKGV